MKNQVSVTTAALSVLMSVIFGQLAHADNDYNISVFTMPLKSALLNLNAPFLIDFQLIGSDNNTVTLSGFNFGGGAATGSSMLFG